MIFIVVRQVDELKESLTELQDLATSSTTNLERNEAKHKTELENLKVSGIVSVISRSVSVSQ